MAEEEQKYVDYKDDPAKYAQQCKREWDSWFDKFKSRIEENVQLFNNYDPLLAERKKDKTLSRACLFIPIVNTAVQSRTAHLTKLIFSVDQPIEVIPKRGTPKKNAENVKALIKDLFTKDKFKLTYMKAKMAQEMYPISFLKVSEIEEEEKELVVEEEEKELEGIPHFQAELGKFKKWKTSKGQSRPTVGLRTQESVFYDVSVTEWSQVKYVGEIIPLTLSEIVARKKTRGYKFDTDELKTKGKKIKETDEVFRRKVETATGSETKSGVGKSDKYEVLEMFHIVEKEDGTTEKKLTVSCGDVKLKDANFPYEKLDICDLFIPLIGYPILNRIEGNTTVDLMKNIQHALNDFFNLIIDTAKYGLFAPRERDSSFEVLNEEILAPGVEWKVQVPQGKVLADGSRQIFNVTPTGKDFFVLINVLREFGELISGAPEDILGAGATDPEEKATKTKFRASAASSRLAGINLLMDVEVLKKLGYVLWVITLERLPYDKTYDIEQGYGENGEPEVLQLGIDDINGHLAFDVPHLSGMAEREIKLRRLDELLMTLNELGLFSHPVMLPVLYRLLKKRADLSLLTEFDEILPPEAIEQLAMSLQGQQGGQGGGTPAGKGATEGGSPLEAFMNLLTAGGK